MRLVSFVHRSVAAIRYEVEPLDGETRIVVQPRSSPTRTSGDVARTRAPPRSWRRALVSESHGTHELRAVLVHRTRESALRMAARMDHEVDGPRARSTENESFDGLAPLTVTPRLGHGETLTLTRAWPTLVRPALNGLHPRPGRRRARVRAAHGSRPARRPARVPRRLLEARRRPDRWRHKLQQAVRSALFHACSPRRAPEKRAIAAGPERRRLRRTRLLGRPRASCCRC